MDDGIREILSALGTDERSYPRETLDAALAMRDEITPYLIAVLRQVLEDPEYYAWGGGSGAYIFALQLFGHWQEPRAHDVIVDLVSLRGETPFDLFGDTITEELSVILFATCGWQVGRIVDLLRDREANEYCRSAAARALVYAVVEGAVPRQEVVALFGSLLTDDEPNAHFLELLANAVCDLYPEELMETIKAAYGNERIVWQVVDYPFFLETLERGRAAAYAEAKSELRRHMPADFHERLSWWAPLTPEQAPTTETLLQELLPLIGGRSARPQEKPRKKGQRSQKEKTRPPRKKRRRKP